MTNTLKDLLRSKLTDFSEKDAFIILEADNSEKKLSYKELDNLSTDLSNQFNQITEFGDRVLVILPPGENYISTLFGCFYSGLVAVPVYPPNPAALVQSIGLITTIGADSESKLIITNSQIKNALFSLKDKFTYFADVEWFIVDNPEKITGERPNVIKPERKEVNENDLSLLLYTSGSTGDPKGVMLTHKNLVHNAKIMSESCKFNSETKFCIWLPPYHVSGLFSGIILPVYSGSTNILFSPLQFVENPFKWLKTISDYRVTASGSPTFAYDICNKFIPAEKLKEIDLSCWKTAVVGGEAIKKEVVDKFVDKFSECGFSENTFFTMFGLTESTMISTGRGHLPPKFKYISRKKLEENIAEKIATNSENGMYLTCSGSPLSEMNVIVVDSETLKPCSDNTVGEIWVNGASVARGYWKKSEETEKTFNAYTNETNSQGPFLRTGDFGYFSNNELYVTGRMKEVLIIRGVNHYPEDIEKTIKNSFADSDFIECAVFQSEINNNEELIIALELSPALKENSDSTISLIKKEVAKNHGLTPYGFIILAPNELPRTATRKIQRKRGSKNVSEGKWVPEYTTTKSNSENIIMNTKKSISKQELINLTSENKESEILDFLKNLFSLRLEIEEEKISGEMVLASFGFDSILTVNIITDIRNSLDMSVPVSKFFDETTLTMLVKYISNSISGIEENEDEIDFVKETTLSEEIKLNQPFNPDNFICENIFLTGATGFLGGYLLNDFLEKTNSKIYCLVRAKDKTEGLNRLKNNLEKSHQIRDDFSQRVIPILGDLTSNHLGISDNEFTELSNLIDVVFHNGASVNFVAPYASIKSANVDSTIELLKLSTKNKTKPIHFVSTLAVFNSSDRNDYQVFYEDMTTPNPEKLFGGYPKSKYISETLLLEAKKRGIPVTIHRPGLITGDSNNGFTNQDDFFCRLIKGCIELSAFPKLNFDLDMTPVNYVSSAIASLITEKESINKIFHLVNPEPIKFSKFVNWIIDFGYKAEVLSYENWLKNLWNAKEDNALFPLLPFVAEKHTPDKITFLEMYNNNNSPKFDNQNISKILNNTGITCHSADYFLLDCYFKYFINSNFLNAI